MIGQIEVGIDLIELGIGLIELGIGLRISNAQRTVLARVCGLVSFFLLIVYGLTFFCIKVSRVFVKLFACIKNLK